MEDKEDEKPHCDRITGFRRLSIADQPCNETQPYVRNPPNMGYALLGLGLVDLAENKPEARKNILGSLRLRVETGEQHQQTFNLIGAAGLALGEGNAQFAAELLGAVESVLKALNAVVETELEFFYEDTQAQVREVLGEKGFKSAWDEGSTWSLEETVARVLDDHQG